MGVVDEAIRRASKRGIAATAGVVGTGLLAAVGAFAAAPSNDNFANAEGLEGSYAKVFGTTLSATREPGEPAQNKGNSVWYSWTALHTGLADAGTCGSVGTALPRVYTGDAIAALTPVQGRVVNCYFDEPTEARRLIFAVTAGTTYRIAIDDGDPPDPSNFNLELVERPDNDLFADAEVLQGRFPIVARGNAANGSTEPAELTRTGVSDGASTLWYSWTARRAGRVVVQLCRSKADGPETLLAFSGGSLQTLRRANTVPARFYASRCPLARKSLPFGLKVSAGTTYRLQVQASPTTESNPFALVINHEDVYDIAVRQTASPRRVARRGVVRIEATVSNRGNVRAPPPGQHPPFLALYVSKPGTLLRPADARPLSARVRGSHCFVGRIGVAAIGASCRLPSLAPGESVKVISRVRADNAFDSYARLEFYSGGSPELDDIRRNNDQSIPIRPRR
jgi:hypothetical protein